MIGIRHVMTANGIMPFIIRGIMPFIMPVIMSVIMLTMASCTNQPTQNLLDEMDETDTPYSVTDHHDSELAAFMRALIGPIVMLLKNRSTGPASLSS